MKSWIAFFMPNDEYKEKRMLYFVAEGGILLILYLIAMLFLHNYFQLDLGIVLLLGIGVFIFYVSLRYMLSGMEYTEIATERAYKRELRVIATRTIGFVFIFTILYFIFVEIPVRWSDWIEILGLLCSVSLLWFVTSFISLRRSYKKNMELL